MEKKNVPFSFLHFMLSAFFLSCASTTTIHWFPIELSPLEEIFPYVIFPIFVGCFVRNPLHAFQFCIFLVHDIKYIGHPGHPRKGLDL